MGRVDCHWVGSIVMGWDLGSQVGYNKSKDDISYYTILLEQRSGIECAPGLD